MSKRKKGSSDIEVRKDIPPEVEREFQRQWNERFLESPPRAYTIEEYMKRRKEMKEFAHNFWKEYEEELKERKKRRKAKRKEKKRERKARKKQKKLQEDIPSELDAEFEEECYERFGEPRAILFDSPEDVKRYLDEYDAFCEDF